MLLTSDLLFETENDRDGLVQDEQFGLRFIALQVQLHHAPELLKCLVDVSYTQTLSRVVRHPSLALALDLLLRSQILIIVGAARV